MKDYSYSENYKNFSKLAFFKEIFKIYLSKG